jgi:hypothetical protein
MQVEIHLSGLDKLMQMNRRFSAAVPGAILNGIRNQVRQTITTVKRDIRTRSGLGNRIWGKNGSGLNKIVTLVKSRAAGGQVETGIKLKGMAAMIESGGQTKPHIIKGKPYLAFPGKGGSGFTITKRVNHPGAPVRRHDFARQALDRDGQKINAAVAASLQRTKERIFGAA